MTVNSRLKQNPQLVPGLRELQMMTTYNVRRHYHNIDIAQKKFGYLSIDYSKMMFAYPYFPGAWTKVVMKQEEAHLYNHQSQLKISRLVQAHCHDFTRCHGSSSFITLPSASTEGVSNEVTVINDLVCYPQGWHKKLNPKNPAWFFWV